MRYPGKWVLSSPERQQLELFHQRAQELSKYGIKGFPCAATISLFQGECTVKAELPDEAILRSASIAARLFYMNDEPTHFFTICGLLWRAAQDQQFKDAVAACRKSFSDFKREGISGASALSNGRQVETKGGLLDAFFNGGYFHSDKELREFVVRCDEGLGLLFKQRFAQCIHEIDGLVGHLNQLVENALGVDQLATTEQAKGVQSILTSMGYQPTVVNVWWSARESTVQAEFMDLQLSRKHTPIALGKVLDFLRSSYPKAKYVIVDYLDEDGDLRGIAWPELPPRPSLS